jgi:hypothetical protein
MCVVSFVARERLFLHLLRDGHGCGVSPRQLGTSLLALQQGFQYKLSGHLRLNVFDDMPNFTRAELDLVRDSHGNGVVPRRDQLGG